MQGSGNAAHQSRLRGLRSPCNAELFLQLAGALASRMETLAIKRSSPVLSASDQQYELVRKAADIILRWNFPYARKVTDLVEGIAAECVEETRSRTRGSARAQTLLAYTRTNWIAC